MRPLSWRLVFLAMIVWSTSLYAQCRSNEIMVGEDQDNYFCKDRLEYAACIKSAGSLLRQDRKDCAYKVQHVFTNARSGLSNSALSCVAGCLGNGLTARGCLSSCGVGAVYPVQVLEEAVQETSSCLEQSLSADKQRREECKR